MPELFNVHGFGPPDPFTGRSTWPRVDHGVSGRMPTTTVATLRLAFASAPVLDTLALLLTCTRRPIMQKVRRHPLPLRAIGLRPLVSVRFQVLFTRLIAVLFIVQSPYLFTIGHRGIFSLGRWSGQLHAEFHELRATLVRLSTPSSSVTYGTVTRSGRPFQTVPLDVFQLKAPATPGRIPVWAHSLSLAATHEIDVSFFSCGYLDVSGPHVRSTCPIHSDRSNTG
jgi:hypothetical protein